jgi:hypothetical protein
MDEARALLDQLMGKDRDKPPEQRRARHFSDPDVCKHFLCGGKCSHRAATRQFVGVTAAAVASCVASATVCCPAPFLRSLHFGANWRDL